MQFRIEILEEKKFIGKRIIMSLNENKTKELWQSFMPRRKEIKNNIGTDLYSIKIYNDKYFNAYNPNMQFSKWAAVEVSNFSIVPEGMETITLTGGLYAVFHYKGSSNMGDEAFKYIITEWLPASDYCLNNRPHFDVLGEKYKNDSPDSEEELWIPVRLKTE